MELGSNRTRSSPNKPFSRRFRNFLVTGKSPQRNRPFKLTIPTQAKVNPGGGGGGGHSGIFWVGMCRLGLLIGTPY